MTGGGAEGLDTGWGRAEMVARRGGSLFWMGMAGGGFFFALGGAWGNEATTVAADTARSLAWGGIGAVGGPVAATLVEPTMLMGAETSVLFFFGEALSESLLEPLKKEGSFLT